MVTLAARTEESRKKKCRNGRFFYAVVRAAGGISHPQKLIKTRCKMSAIARAASPHLQSNQTESSSLSNEKQLTQLGKKMAKFQDNKRELSEMGARKFIVHAAGRREFRRLHRLLSGLEWIA